MDDLLQTRGIDGLGMNGEVERMAVGETVIIGVAKGKYFGR